jgi:hypothetical protein
MQAEAARPPGYHRSRSSCGLVTLGSMKPILRDSQMVLCTDRYPSLRADVNTACVVCSLIRGLFFKVREAVDSDTPAR